MRGALLLWFDWRLILQCASSDELKCSVVLINFLELMWFGMIVTWKRKYIGARGIIHDWFFRISSISGHYTWFLWSTLLLGCPLWSVFFKEHRSSTIILCITLCNRMVPRNTVCTMSLRLGLEAGLVTNALCSYWIEYLNSNYLPCLLRFRIQQILSMYISSSMFASLSIHPRRRPIHCHPVTYIGWVACVTSWFI